MPNKIITWVGNADDGDNSAIIRLGLDGAGNPINLLAGKSLELTEAQIAKIHGRHVLVEGDVSSTVSVRDPSDFHAQVRRKNVTPIGK